MGGYLLILSCVAFGFSLSHTFFYHMQRKVQTSDFMRGLACRMKALFAIMSLMFALNIVISIGIIKSYDHPFWEWITLARIAAIVLYIAALFWLYRFYRRPHV